MWTHINNKLSRLRTMTISDMDMSQWLDPKSGSACVLVVDDQFDNILIIEKQLQLGGFEVKSAHSGEEALALVRQQAFDLFLLDIRMPGMDGFELCERLKAEASTADIPIIFLSGLGEALDKEKAFSLGCVDYIIKPCETSELLARINTHISLARIQSQLWQARDTLEEMVVDRTRELEEANSSLRRLTQRMDKVREEEKKRLAREIHDDLGHTHTALNIGISQLQRKLADKAPELLPELAELGDLVRYASDASRRIMSELRPAVLEDLGLVAALEWQAQEFEAHYGLSCVVTATDLPLVLNDDAAIVLFRVFQEALINVVKHADASKVRTLVDCDDEWLWMRIEDNGRGFPADWQAKEGSYGIQGMQERLNALHGRLYTGQEASSGGGNMAHVPGARLTIKVPLAEIVEAADSASA